MPAEDEQVLTDDIIELASRFGRYGYRRITALLRHRGWSVNHKRVERIWRQEGLKVPSKQPRRAKLWLNDGSCIRLRPERPNHVWAYDFVLVRTRDGRAVRLPTVIDEYSRECLAIRADRHIESSDVIETLTEVMESRGVPDHIRSDNGPEFTVRAIRDWPGKVGARALYIEPGSPWENGYVESFNGKLRDELLDRDDLLCLEGGAGIDRDVQADLQGDQTPQFAGLQTAGTGDCRACASSKNAHLTCGANIGGRSICVDQDRSFPCSGQSSRFWERSHSWT